MAHQDTPTRRDPPVAERFAAALPFLLEEHLGRERDAGPHLRQTCRDLRAGHDRAAQQLCLGSPRKLYIAPVAPWLPAWSCLTDWRPPPPEEIETSLRGRLARGFRPSSVSIQLPWAPGDESTSEQCVLSLLRTVAAAGSVALVRLGEQTPLTPQVAHAIAGVGPKLAGLHITHGDSLRDRIPDLLEPPPLTPERLEAAAATGRLLLRLLGAAGGGGLRELHLVPSERYWPAAALDSLSYCTALTKLQLRCELSMPRSFGAPLVSHDAGLAAESSLLRTLSGLTSLRDLSLYGGCRPPHDTAAAWRRTERPGLAPPGAAAVRQARAASLESCLSALTALTRLDIGIHSLQHFPRWDLRETQEEGLHQIVRSLKKQGRHEEEAQLLAAVEAEWRALAAAARRMPGLRELRTPARANAADLASLTALTSLTVGAMVVRPPPQDPSPSDQRNQPPPPPPVYDLPPLLQRLVVYAPLSVHVAAALRPSPSPPAATAAAAALAGAPPAPVTINSGGAHWGCGDVQLSLEFSDGDVDRRGRLTAEAVAAMRRATAGLQGSFFELAPYPLKTGRGLRVHKDSMGWSPALPPALRDTAAAAGAGAGAAGTHCGSWLGELAALRLEALVLSGLSLSSRDMTGLARSFDGLKLLDLRGCAYEVSSLPALTDLTSLEELRVNSLDWQWPSWEGPSDRVITAAFNSLTAATGTAATDGPGADGSGGGPSSSGGCAGSSGGGAGDGGRDCGGRDSRLGTQVLPPPPLPLLRVVLVDVSADALEWGWLEDALAPAAAELRLRRPVPAELRVSFLVEIEEF